MNLTTGLEFQSARDVHTKAYVTTVRQLFSSMVNQGKDRLIYAKEQSTWLKTESGIFQIANKKRKGEISLKKEYEAPKAERMEFNYSEVVVASGTKVCDNVTPMTWHNSTPGNPCLEQPSDSTVYADVFPV